MSTRGGRGGCLVKVLLLLVVLGAAAALAWMVYLPIWVTDELRARTGGEATVASLACDPFGGRLVVRGLVLKQPADAPVREFLEMPEFVAEGSLTALWGERLELDAVTLDVRRLTLVRRAEARGPAAAGPAAPSVPYRPFLIRRLQVKFDRLVIIDDTGARPVRQEHRLALDQRYENVTSLRQLAVPAVLQRVAEENLGPALGRLVPGDLGQALGAAARDAAASGAERLQGAGQRANELLQGLREKLEETRKP